MMTKGYINVCRWLILGILVLGLTPLYATVKLPALVGNGMILQRDKPIKIWGWAAPGEKITVDFNGRSYSTTTDANSRWSLFMRAMKAGGPHEMEIMASNKIILRNILIGDVWICSGQSNMEFTMDRVKDTYKQEIENADNKMIRQFLVRQKWSFNELEDVQPSRWAEVNPNTVGEFTAVGYFFALSVYEKYRIPIGLINNAVGGTPVEAWISQDGLATHPIYSAEAEFFKNQDEVDKLVNKDNSIKRAWLDYIQREDKGTNLDSVFWYSNAFNFSSWPKINLPGFWQNQGVRGASGVIWLKKTVIVPEELIGKDGYIELGNIVEQDTTYINGVRVGYTGTKHMPRKYPIPSGLLKKGENVITVRVIDTEGRGGFIYGKPYHLVIKGQRISLNGPWRYQLGVKTDPLRPVDFTNFLMKPTVWYNSRIAPCLQYQIKGVLWYQGEANVGKENEYKSLFPALIKNWRKKFKQGDLPFLFVQLANLGEIDSNPSDHPLPRLREAQMEALSLKNTGMAVTHDIGEWNDIHPQNKKDVALRLFAVAEKVAYGMLTASAAGPLYKSMKVDGNKIIIYFKNVGSGLVSKNGKELRCFAIGNINLEFEWAKAEISGKDKVVVWSDKVRSPAHVRYAWSRNPQDVNLYNKEGLPVAAFRTDKEAR